MHPANYEQGFLIKFNLIYSYILIYLDTYFIFIRYNMKIFFYG